MKRIYSDSGQTIDITPLPFWARRRLTLHMLGYRIRNNRRIVLLLARWNSIR